MAGHALLARGQEALRALLGRMVREKGVAGATLITRDGLCVINSEDRILAPETFSAMSAALMAAAETALAQFGTSGPVRISAETDNAKMVAVGASDQLLLVVLGNGTATVDELHSKAEATAKKIHALIDGG